MTTHTFLPPKEKLSLKEAHGWFAAGSGFHKAMAELSDGAFKLFAYVCLHADRSTGRLETTHRQLAKDLAKSKRAIGSYVDELQHKGVCAISRGRNQYATTQLLICDDYWPYHRQRGDLADPEANDSGDSGKYIAAIREAFLAIAYGSGKFGTASVRAAQGMHRDGVPLSVVLDAMLLGTSRKYIAWDNNAMMPVEVIAGVAYFRPLIEEVQKAPFADDYREYLCRKNVQLAESWKKRARPRQQPLKGG